VQLAHDRQDGELLAGEFGALPPAAAAEGLLDDPLPGKPRSRSPSWMPHRSSGRRFGHGVPAGLSIAKSAVAAKAGPTQQSAAQREQSARRCDRSSSSGRSIMTRPG